MTTSTSNSSPTSPLGPSTSEPDDPIELRFGHPIRWFVVLLLALAALTVTCWWPGCSHRGSPRR